MFLLLPSLRTSSLGSIVWEAAEIGVWRPVLTDVGGEQIHEGTVHGMLKELPKV
jgi:hypothetical protein